MAGILLEAHKGVESDYPGNTLAAFRAAAELGFAGIELDPNYTKDGKIVVLHDNTINNTARRADGSVIESETRIAEITYDEALQYDFGLKMGETFRGEKLPLLSDALAIAKSAGMFVEVDFKFLKFPRMQRELLYEVIRQSRANVTMSLFSASDVAEIKRELPNATITHPTMEDGARYADVIKEFAEVVPKEELTIAIGHSSVKWLHKLENPGFANEENCCLAKRYGKLMIWNLSSMSAFMEARELGADIVETDGSIKPEHIAGMD